MADVGVVICTRNRRDDLLRALRSVDRQTADVETVVVIDGGEDDTATAVRRDFPDVDLLEDSEHRGPAAQRNRAARRLDTPIIVWLDDDAELPSEEILAQAIEAFDHERVGAVGIPFIEPSRGSRIKQQALRGSERWLTDSFHACCAAVRRDAFFAVGGFDESLFIQGEEPDLCLKLLAHGWVTALARTDLAVHHISAARDDVMIIRQQTRNQILIPIRYGYGLAMVRDLFMRLTFSAARAARSGQPRAVGEGLLEGISEGRGGGRTPLPPDLYRLSQRLELERLRNRPSIHLEQIEHLLPAQPRRTS